MHSNTKEKPLFKSTFQADDLDSREDTATNETYSNFDDTSSILSLDDADYVVTALQHKVDRLQHELEIKDKDI